MRNHILRKNNLQEASSFGNEELARSFHRRKHPQEEELERFKREFKAWEETRIQELCSGRAKDRRKGKKPVEPTPSIKGNPNDLLRFPELKFNKRVDRSPSPTRIVILKPTSGRNEEIEELWPWSPGIPMRKDVRERLKSEAKAKGKEKIRREKLLEGSSTSGCRPRNIYGRRSTGSTVKDELEVRTRSFRDGSGNREADLGRCFSEPICGAALARVLPGEWDNDMRFEPTTKMKKPKKDFFNLKGRILNLRRALTLGGKLFRRKNRTDDDPLEITTIAPSVQLNDKDNSTEVPPSPASISTFHEDTTLQWKPSLPSPVSPLEIPLDEDLPPQVSEETSSDNPEVQALSSPSKQVSDLHSDEDLKLTEENYLRRILLTAGFFNQSLNLILALCYSPTEPLAKWVFNEVEKDLTLFGKGNEDTKFLETVSFRRMLFDLLNEQLLCLISSTEVNSMKRRPIRRGEELTKSLWKRIERCLGFIRGKSISLDSLISDDLNVNHWILHEGFYDVDEALEGMILSQLVDEFVEDFYYLGR